VVRYGTSVTHDSTTARRRRRAVECRRAGRPARGYGIATGQTVAPLVVQTMRPWIAGLTGLFAVM
jgi:hypothetical protein